MKKSTNYQHNFKRNYSLLFLCSLANPWLAGLAHADSNSENITPIYGQSTVNACSGTYTYFANAHMTNGTLKWINFPTNADSCTFSDLSTYPPPYCSLLVATSKNGQFVACGTNSVYFPVKSTNYSLYAYVLSTNTPPTNGQTITLQYSYTTN